MQKKSFSTFIELKCSHTEKFGPPFTKIDKIVSLSIKVVKYRGISHFFYLLNYN